MVLLRLQLNIIKRKNPVDFDGSRSKEGASGGFEPPFLFGLRVITRRSRVL